MLNSLFRRRPLLEELEPRILFSADLAPIALDSLAPAPEQRVISADGEFTHVAASLRNELVIVDTGVQGYEILLADILDQAGNDRRFSVVILDADRDGIQQITDVLKQYGNLDAVHLISHGGPGSLQLGSSQLDAATLDGRAEEIAAWGNAFNADADWLIYGCEVAAGVDGEAFVHRLSELTRTDVAASDDLTGDTALGGDWDLEFAAGRIETRLAVSAGESQWHGLLETLANNATSNTDANASVAVNVTTGAFVVTWTSDGDQDGDNEGVYARIYTSAGNPVSSQILVNTTTEDTQRNSAAAMDASGNFVVVWESKTDDYGIFGQRFNAAGAKIGGQFVVNQTALGDQTDATIAMAADGQFIVAWKDARNGGDIYARHFDSSGAAISNEFRVNANTASGQYAPAVAIKNDGGYVVVWQSDTGGSGKAVFAQRFSATDVKLGVEFRVNTYDANDQTEPSIAMAPDGSFVIAWSSNSQDGSNRGVYAQRYDSGGVAAGVEFRVNTHTSGHQDRPTVAMDGSGNFVIAWTSDGQDNGGSYGVYAQRYFANGAANGGEFRVNTTTSNHQQNPTAGMSDAGKLVVAWDGNGPGDDKGIFWQSYELSNTPPVANPDSASTDEDTAISSAAPGVLGNDVDPDLGAVLSVIDILAGTTGTPTAVTAGGVTIAGAYGSLLVRQNGSYTYTPNATTAQALAAGQTATDVFTYTIKDDKNATAASTLSFTVNGLNDAPVASPDSYAVLKTDVLTILPAGVLGNDADADTDPAPDTLSVTRVNGSALNVGNAVIGTYGTLILDANGGLTYTPDSGNPLVSGLAPGDSVVDAFTYEVSDGKGGSSATTLAITVAGSNTAPVANDDAYAVSEDGVLSVPAAGVLGNDTDPEGNALTATLVSGVSNGVLTFNNNGSFTYTPNANFNGTDSFTYQVSDGSLTSTTAATVTLSVTSVNDDPVAYADTGAVNQDATLNVGAALGVLSNDTDPDMGDPHTVTLVEAGSSAAPVSPGTPGVLTSSFGTLTLDADGSYSYIANGDASRALAAGETSDDIFTYTMRDAAGVTSSTTLTITVTGSNDAPVAVADTAAAVEAGGVANGTAGTDPTGNVLSNDTDADSGDTRTVTAFSFGATGGTPGSALPGNYGALTLYADRSYVYGVDNNHAAVQALRTSADTLTETFSYSVQDAAGATSSSTLTITITGSNDAPTTTPVTLAAITEDSGARLITQAELLANAGDVDDAALTASALVISSGNGTLVDNLDGTWTYTPAPHDDSSVSFSYTITDGSASVAGSATLDITPVNDDPVISTHAVQFAEEKSAASVTVTATDQEGDLLSFAVTGGADAALFTIDASSGVLRLNFVPEFDRPRDANRDNIYEVTVTVSDGNGGTAALTIQLIITDKVDATSVLPVTSAGSGPAADNTTPDNEADPDSPGAPLAPMNPVNPLTQASAPAADAESTPAVSFQVATPAAPASFLIEAAQMNRGAAPAMSVLVALNQALGALTSDARALNMLQTSLGSSSFQQQLDQLQETIRQQLSLDKHTIASTLAVSTGLSVGYVLWLVRGGVLLSSLLTSMPAWRLIDPLPILGHLATRKHGPDEDDSLEGMLKKSNARPAPTPHDAPEGTP